MPRNTAQTAYSLHFTGCHTSYIVRWGAEPGPTPTVAAKEIFSCQGLFEVCLQIWGQFDKLIFFFYSSGQIADIWVGRRGGLGKKSNSTLIIYRCIMIQERQADWPKTKKDK